MQAHLEDLLPAALEAMHLARNEQRCPTNARGPATRAPTSDSGDKIACTGKLSVAYHGTPSGWERGESGHGVLQGVSCSRLRKQDTPPPPHLPGDSQGSA